MHHDFKDFLCNGGNGEYVIRQRNGLSYGKNLSVKSQFPGDDRLRQAFRQRLETVAAENARMILSALTPPDSVPLYSEADLLPASDVIEQVLQAWDQRLADIEFHYQNHPQRIRPLRVNMEDRTALAFAGMINQLRQEDLGIERYVWVTQGDHKVRSAHAALNGEVFEWDDPSEEGHPGQAPNCRCRAVPVRQDRADVVLADFILPADGIGALPETALRAALQRLVAQTPAGAAVLAAMGTAVGLRQLGEMIGDARLHRAADHLGLDVTSVEGLWAAYASVWMSEMVATGFGTSIDKDQDLARIAGQAAALYELMRPGTMQQIARSGNFAALSQFVTEAARAYADGQLRLTTDGWAQGWAEVFAGLDSSGMDLLDLPGLTANALAEFGGTSSPHIVYSSDAQDRELPEGVPGVDSEGRPVQPAPAGRGLPEQGAPGTWIVGPRGDRLYGADGRAEKDVDWAHDHGQGRPHVHDWEHGKRKPGRPPQKGEDFSREGRREDGQIYPEDWGSDI